MQFSLFIKIKVELLGKLLVLLMHLTSDETNFTLSSIVKSAVEKNKFHVLHKVLNFLILVLLKLCFDRLEIHWVCDNRWII